MTDTEPSKIQIDMINDIMSEARKIDLGVNEAIKMGWIEQDGIEAILQRKYTDGLMEAAMLIFSFNRRHSQSNENP